MEPHRNIAHNRKKHIDFYVGAYVPDVPMWFKTANGSFNPIVTKNNLCHL